MLLVIDIGNTNTVLGFFDGDEAIGSWRIETSSSRTHDELGVMLQMFAATQQRELADVDSAILACVVPSAAYPMLRMCREYARVEPLQVGPGIKTGVPILYDNPRDVGADRIVNAVAAHHLVGDATVVVDFGTATTFDCIRADGSYLGGVIAPGFQISAEALFKATSKLPRVEPGRPPSVIGRNTIHSIQSGLYFGYVELVDGMCRRIREEMQLPGARVLATGGLAPLIAKGSSAIDQVVEDLTLLGLRLLHRRNQS
ncbi:MAG: type III pantothenate kinase [Myxococcota bacterium]|nr:type III pantothenate kinase [Myxococcota bacterium]